MQPVFAYTLHLRLASCKNVAKRKPRKAQNAHFGRVLMLFEWHWTIIRTMCRICSGRNMPHGRWPQIDGGKNGKSGRQKQDNEMKKAGRWFWGYRIMNQQKPKTCVKSQAKRAEKTMVAHSPVNPRRAESPMTSSAQGKRSDTLGIMCRGACALLYSNWASFSCEI